MGVAGAIWLGSMVGARPVMAASSCSSVYAGFTISGNLPSSGYEYDNPGSIELTLIGVKPNSQYKIFCSDNSGFMGGPYSYADSGQPITTSSNRVTAVLDGAKCFGPKNGEYSAINSSSRNRFIYVESNAGNCDGPTYTVNPYRDSLNCNSSNIQILQGGKKVGCVLLGESFEYSVSGITKKSGGACSKPSDNSLALTFGINNSAVSPPLQQLSTSCSISGTTQVTSDGNEVGHNLVAKVYGENGQAIPGCTKTIPIRATCSQAERDQDPDAFTQAKPFNLCEQIKFGTPAREQCIACLGGGEDGTEVKAVWTAVGCIKNDPKAIIITVIRIGLGIAGGVALLMILAASFTFSTSAGDAKKIDEARDMITSAVIGLIFIIMSITILQFVGVQLLHIPGFGES